MVTVPVANDGLGCAARVKWLGVGEMLPLTRLRADRLRPLVTAVLNRPSYREKAVQVGEEIRKVDGIRAGEHQVTIVQTGLGAAEGEITLHYFPGAPGNSTLYPDGKRREFGAIVEHVRFADSWRFLRWKALIYHPLRHVASRVIDRALANSIATPCRIRTLSGVIREHGINRVDLLKIDVEGAEFDVLDGIEDGHWPLVRQMAMEVAPACKPRLRGAVEKLRFLGFESVKLESMTGEEPNLEDPLPCNLYATRLPRSRQVR